MDQDQFSFEEGARRREEGINRADKHANEQWKDVALDAVRKTARELRFFVADEVWKRMPATAKTHENRALGAVMRKAAGFGWIKATDRFRTTEQKKSHRRPIREWESQIHLTGGEVVAT
jgi:hypothetical protein